DAMWTQEPTGAVARVRPRRAGGGAPMSAADANWRFALDLTRPAHQEFMPTEAESWPAKIPAGVCPCCHYPAAVIEWHAVPSSRDCTHAVETVRVLWAGLSLRG